ncbi:MAG TPA: hypothetical protein VFO53_06715 [Casimicrobiaceae bacterium]|nr:hypothetical protein [Casimicrobiaceae bacterium]
MTRLGLVALALMLAAGARAQAPAALGNIDVESDTDGFHASRVRIGALYPYGSYVDHLGAAVQSTHYSQGNWSRDASGIVGLWRDQDARTLTGVNAEAGVVRVAGHTRAVGDATWGLRPAANTGVELIAAGDLVATRKAIERGIAYGFVAASVEQTFAERFTAIALAGYQPFTDGNDRVHWRGRLIWQAVPDYGVNVQLRYRGYESGRSDVGGAYFNPDRYRQWQGALGVRRRVGSWVWTASAGAGRETINSNDTHPVRVAELRGEGAVTDRVRLALYALYSRSTGYVDAPDYAYRQVGVTLIYPF